MWTDELSNPCLRHRTAACQELSFLLPVSLRILARPKALLAVAGVWCWDVCGWLFLVWFCYLPIVVVTLAPFLAAQMFCGFQAKRLENVPSQRVLLKVWAWEPRLSFLGLLVTCCNEVWAFACNSLCPGWRVRTRRWQGPADSPRRADAVCSLTPLLLLGKCQSDVARSPHLVSSKQTTKLK